MRNDEGSVLETKNVTGWLGVGSLVLACAIGGMTFPKNFLWFFESSVTFAPDLLSGLIAALALLPLWRKGDLAAPFHGPVTLIAIIPLFYLCSVLVNIGLGGSGTSLLKLPVVWMLLILLVLANLNIGKYAELAIIVILFLVSWNITTASAAMGVYGFPFLVASLCGVVLTFNQKKIFREVVGKPFPEARLMGPASQPPISHG
jgi:hypothetical protein